MQNVKTNGDILPLSVAELGAAGVAFRARRVRPPLAGDAREMPIQPRCLDHKVSSQSPSYDETVTIV